MNSNSPFTNNEAERIMTNFVQKEVFPVINNLKDISSSLHLQKQSLVKSFFRKELNSTIVNHQQVSGEFLRVNKKLSTPDLLFKDIKGDDPSVIVDYFNFQPVIKKQIDEGFQLLEIIDRHIDRKLNVANQYVTNTIALLSIIIALTTSVFTILWERDIFFESARSIIAETDQSNLQIACQIKSAYKNNGEALLLDYNTQTYTENFGIINKQPPAIKEAIRNNIALMQASNKMMELLFEQPQKWPEFSPKLINNANAIIQNLDVYNEQTITGECADSINSNPD